MKKHKKIHYDILGLMSVCFLMGIFLAVPVKAEAATFQTGWGSDKMKTGKYYVWVDDKSDSVVVSTSQSGDGRVIATASGKREMNGSFMSDGSTVFYAEKIYKEDYALDYIYKISIQGKRRTYIGKMKDMNNFEACYGGNLYVSCWDFREDYQGEFDPCHIYRINIKTGKTKCVVKNATVDSQYKRYLLASAPTDAAYAPRNFYVFDCKTEKAVRIGKNIRFASFSANKVYYAEGINDTAIRVLSCSLSGKNKKTIVKKLTVDGGAGVGRITSKYVYYLKGGKPRRYNIKTKKSEKISEKKYLSW
ncbi:MAG TPA: hypothetical protein DF613_13130 [Lachnospiraceae bacterium]|nr:hypothetical protein [Lachnospiraceae bacterium]